MNGGPSNTPVAKVRFSQDKGECGEASRAAATYLGMGSGPSGCKNSYHCNWFLDVPPPLTALKSVIPINPKCPCYTSDKDGQMNQRGCSQAVCTAVQAFCPRFPKAVCTDV